MACTYRSGFKATQRIKGKKVNCALFESKTAILFLLSKWEMQSTRRTVKMSPAYLGKVAVTSDVVHADL